MAPQTSRLIILYSHICKIKGSLGCDGKEDSLCNNLEGYDSYASRNGDYYHNTREQH